MERGISTYRRKAAEAKNVELAKELESLHDRAEQRCVKIDVSLDKLSVDFDEELYPHMLTVIAGRRWVIGHALRLTVMKCDESLELSQTFADVMSARLMKVMREDLKHGIEHGRASRDLEAIESYGLEADSKYVKALQDLEDLSSSKLKIPIYPEVCDPKDPWAFEEEVLLEDAITANRSRAMKKRKCKVVYRTHGVGSDHHSKFDGVPVSVPTVDPRGLVILLDDAATQTERLTKKINHIQDYNDPSPCHLFII
nr:hypothetical protein [Tanacetum cinerariifolium]